MSDPAVRELRHRIIMLERAIRTLGGGGTPGAHSGSHENGGSDEIDVTGLTGLLATAQTPAAHATSHQNAGGDEISVAGLSGLLADAQAITVRKNTGADVGTRPRLNFIEGSNVTLTVADDGANSEVDVTITASGTISISGAMVQKSADQTGVDYTTSTAIAWNQEVYDDNAFHDNATNNTRLTIPSGVTRVNLSASVRIQSITASLTCILTLLKNGSVTFDGAVGFHGFSDQTARPVSLTALGVPCTTGDYFEVFLQVITDTSVDIIATRSTFTIQAVG